MFSIVVSTVKVFRQNSLGNVNPAFLTKKENGVSESPTQYRFEPDFSPATPTTVCCENLTRHRHQLDLRKKELICVKFTQIN